MFQQAKGNVDAKAFQDAGCVVGVNNASFEVHKGEMLVVMGLSGSGKSTLLRCISRLTETTAGDIHIDGEDLLAMSGKQLIELRRNKMGMVFQSFVLLPHKTVLENIPFPLQVKGNSTAASAQFWLKTSRPKHYAEEKRITVEVESVLEGFLEVMRERLTADQYVEILTAWKDKRDGQPTRGGTLEGTQRANGEKLLRAADVVDTEGEPAL